MCVRLDKDKSPLAGMSKVCLEVGRGPASSGGVLGWVRDEAEKITLVTLG